jgi:hypothetical protein
MAESKPHRRPPSFGCNKRHPHNPLHLTLATRPDERRTPVTAAPAPKLPGQTATERCYSAAPRRAGGAPAGPLYCPCSFSATRAMVRHSRRMRRSGYHRITPSTEGVPLKRSGAKDWRTRQLESAGPGHQMWRGMRPPKGQAGIRGGCGESLRQKDSGGRQAGWPVCPFLLSGA